VPERKLREVYFPWLGKSVSNYRYGVTLAIAGKDGAPVNFHYSIEPMTDPGDPEFYKRYILVRMDSELRKATFARGCTSRRIRRRHKTPTSTST
jgi:hypothetical protein